MPVPYPPLPDEDDDETPVGQEPGPQDLSQAGIGDSTQQTAPKPWWQAGPSGMPAPAYDAQQAALAHSRQGPPPPPHPSIWQRLGAAALGGAAGFVNTRQGKPGGLKERLDPTGAEGAVLGTASYQNKLKQWNAQQAEMDKAGQLEEQQNKDRFGLAETVARTAGLDEQRKASAQQRAFNQQDREAQQAQQYQTSTYPYSGVPGAGGNFAPTKTPLPPPPPPNPMDEQESGPQASESPSLPDNTAGEPGMPPAPPQLSLPRLQQPDMGSSPNLAPGPWNMPGWSQAIPPASMTRNGQPPPPPRFSPDPTVAQQMKNDQVAALKQQEADAAMHVVSPQEEDMFNKLNVPFVPAGTKMPNQVFDVYLGLAKKAEIPGKADTGTKGPPLSSDDLMALQAVGVSREDALAGNYTAKQGLAAMAAKHPATNVNNQLPGSVAAPSQLAKDIANYQQQMPVARAYRGSMQEYEALSQQVHAINPDFHAEYFNNFQKTEQDATTGRIGTQANALNTMMGHLSVLNTAIDSLSGGDIKALNYLANQVGVQTGNSAVPVFQAIVHRLGPEITKAYIASGGTQGERGASEDDFNPSLAPQTLKANIAMSAQLADSKIKALQDQYQRGTYGRGQQKLISTEAEQARQRLAVGAGNANPNPNGYIQGHKYGGMTYLGGDPNNAKSWQK